MDDPLLDEIKNFLKGENVMLAGLAAINFFRQKSGDDMTDFFDPQDRRVWGATPSKETGGIGDGSIHPYYGQQYLDYEKAHPQQKGQDMLQLQSGTAAFDRASGLITITQAKWHVVLTFDEFVQIATFMAALPPASPAVPGGAPLASDNQIPKSYPPPENMPAKSVSSPALISRQAQRNEETMKRSMTPENWEAARQSWNKH